MWASPSSRRLNAVSTMFCSDVRGANPSSRFARSLWMTSGGNSSPGRLLCRNLRSELTQLCAQNVGDLEERRRRSIREQEVSFARRPWCRQGGDVCGCVAINHGVGKVLHHGRDAVLNGSFVEPVGYEVPFEFFEHICGPKRSERSSIRKPKEQIIERRAVENVRVEESREGHGSLDFRRSFERRGLRRGTGTLPLSRNVAQPSPTLHSKLLLIFDEIPQRHAAMSSALFVSDSS